MVKHNMLKKLAALSMLHKAKKAYYACCAYGLRGTRTLFTRRQAVAIATCVTASPLPLPSIDRLAARTGCAVHFSLFSRVTLTDEVSGQA